MKSNRFKLPKKHWTPMVVNYRPKLDVTEELKPELANYYQSLIGVLQWAVEIGWIDVTMEVSMLAAHIVLPQIRHLYVMFRVFAYLKNKTNSRMVYNPMYPSINHE